MLLVTGQTERQTSRKGAIMYLKILSRDDDRTNTLIGIQNIEFFHRVLNTPGELNETLNYADLPLVSDGVPQTAYEESENIVRVGCFNITYESGKHQYVVFDGVAFLCNEAGKTVDRYLAN